jgi:hypothetical protein
MIEDDKTIEEMRTDTKQLRTPRSFMTIQELRTLRETVLRVTRQKLCEQLIRPETGRPLPLSTYAFWETGRRAVPLWAARRVRDLAEAARRYDLKGGA